MQRLVALLEDAVEDSQGIILPSEAKLVFFKTPSSTTSGQLSGFIGQTTFAFGYAKSPVGKGSIAYVAPLTTGLCGGMLMTIEIRNFLMVYLPSEVVVKVGPTIVSVESISTTSESHTVFFFISSSSLFGPGACDISVYPVALPQNSAFGSFLYSDDRLPLLTCPSCGIAPFSIYASGGVDMTGVLTQYRTASTTKKDVKVVVSSGI